MEKGKHASRENPRTKTRRKAEILFFFLAIVLFANLFVSFLRYLDSDYDYRIFSYTHTVAVLPAQDVQNLERLDTAVIRLEKTRLEELSVGELVVFGGAGERLLPLADDTVAVVAEVVDIDIEEGSVRLTYNGMSSVTVDRGSILGRYAGRASFFGMYHYAAMYPLGLGTLTLANLLLLWAYHILFLARGGKRSHSPKKKLDLYASEKLSI